MKKQILDLGCGINKVPGAIGIDLVPNDQVDIVHDLRQFPWPLDDGTFDEIIANHFLEHCEDIISTMVEIHRITKKETGRIRIRSPYYTSWNFYGDLTHRVPFSFRSFDHFSYEDPTGYNYYSPVKFKIEFRKILFTGPEEKVNPWRWIGIEYLVNKYPRIYERLFAFIIPATEIQFVLIPVHTKPIYEPTTKASIEPAGLS